MNATQRNFIRKKLIPFILREQGNGFIMNDWISTYTKEEEKEYGKLVYDGVEHRAPVCETVACIGGSCELLLKTKSKQRIANAMGLTLSQAHGLFYDWESDTREHGIPSWPQKYVTAFRAKRTPIGKARVVTRLLEEVIRTNGECLNPTDALSESY